MNDAIFVLFVAALLAYANGANDVSKAVATLVGGGVASYRRALLWGTLWTGLGGLAASVLAGAMLTTFGTGLLAANVSPSFPAAVSALVGASGCVFIATHSRLPVSTTHAIVGSVVGVGVAAYGAGGLAWPALGGMVALPLIVSPIVAFALSRMISRGLSWGFGPSRGAADCLCVTTEAAPHVARIAPRSAALVASPAVGLSVTTGDVERCQAMQPKALRITADHLHWLSSGAVSFARGVNDAPKIVALALFAAALASGPVEIGTSWLFVAVTTGMAGGSFLAGRRVTQVLAEEVTPMNHRDGLAANLVTAALVTTGALYGLPMSTTHVSCGGIVGIGTERRSLNVKRARDIGVAWIVTLPVAALLGAAAYWLQWILRS